jgi:hypothetical protein
MHLLKEKTKQGVILYTFSASKAGTLLARLGHMKLSKWL